MSKDPELLIEDILMAIDRVKRYLGRRTKKTLLSDEMRIDAILRNLTIIGEAASRLPESARDEFSGVDWRRIIAFRNVLIHGHNGIDMDVVWVVVKERLPELEAALRHK